MRQTEIMKRRFYLTAILLLFLISGSFSQKTSLRRQIENIIKNYHSEIGVSISGIENNDTMSINGNKNYPLMSVFKFPIALYVLQQVDKGKLDINQKIFITKSDVAPKTWSPIREKYPSGNIDLSLAEILTYTVSQSDNIGCDILLKLVGGAVAVQNYIDKIGITGFVIKVNEEKMRGDFGSQRINTATPNAATQLLKIFYTKNILTKKSEDFLKKIMTETSTGNDRIKGQLPKEISVAHKTGTSDTNEEGLTIATNDIGIVTLPDGKHFAISVFVSNSKESNDTNAKIISDISKLTWDYFKGMTE
jgi:beta-lactamase class A